MRYIIYGAGAVGGTIGWSLFDSGIDVVLIARGLHLESIRQDGLHLRRFGQTEGRPVPAVGSLEDLRPKSSDVIFLTMKTQDAVSVLPAMARSVDWRTPVVCAQNGVANERFASRWFDNVYGMCVMLPAEHLQPGHITAYGAPHLGALDIGRFPIGEDGIAERVSADLSAAGFSSRPDPAIMRMKYRKLLINLHNALEAMIGEAGRNSDLAEEARAEAMLVLRAAGVDVASAEEDLNRRENIMSQKLMDGETRAGSSTWQSVARGTGSIETDYLNGEIVQLGRIHGVPTPINRGIQVAAHAILRDGRPPGSATLDEVLEFIGR